MHLGLPVKKVPSLDWPIRLKGDLKCTSGSLLSPCFWLVNTRRIFHEVVAVARGPRDIQMCHSLIVVHPRLCPMWKQHSIVFVAEAYFGWLWACIYSRHLLTEPTFAAEISTLAIDETKTLVKAFVTSKLDNSNAFLYGLPKYKTQRLQYVLNSAARLVTLVWEAWSHIARTNRASLVASWVARKI